MDLPLLELSARAHASGRHAFSVFESGPVLIIRVEVVEEEVRVLRRLLQVVQHAVLFVYFYSYAALVGHYGVEVRILGGDDEVSLAFVPQSARLCQIVFLGI